MSPDEWFSCARKTMYGHEATADTAAVRVMKKLGHSKKLVSYKCRYCEGWHIGRPRTGKLIQFRISFNEDRSL